MNAIEDQVRKLRAEAARLALATCLQPKSERDYLLACGRVQQMRAVADELEGRFLNEAPFQEELPDEEDPAPRRAAPQPDRLSRARVGHRPRQM